MYFQDLLEKCASPPQIHVSPKFSLNLSREQELNDSAKTEKQEKEEKTTPDRKIKLPKHVQKRVLKQNDTQNEDLSPLLRYCTFKRQYFFMLYLNFKTLFIRTAFLL